MPKKLPRAKQQGKPYDKKQREEIIKSLKPFLKLEYDLKKACNLAGAPYATVHNWVKKDNALLIKIQSWQNTVITKSRKNLSKAINKGDTELSKWWLERRDKDNFSSRKEVSGANGGPLQVDYVEEAKKRSKNWLDKFKPKKND